jgi:hypothetical protein
MATTAAATTTTTTAARAVTGYPTCVSFEFLKGM